MSTRRTGKITTSTPRGYVAIRVEFLSPETQSLRCTACADKHYVGTEGTFVDIKKGEVFYLVRAASLGADMFYIVRIVTGQKRCSCAGNRPCKHELLVARKEAQRQARPKARTAKKPATPPAASSVPASPATTPSEPAALLPVPVPSEPVVPAQPPTPTPSAAPSPVSPPAVPAAVQQRAAAASAFSNIERVPGTLNGNRPFSIPR